MQLPIKFHLHDALKRFTLPRILVGIIIALLIFCTFPLKTATALSTAVDHLNENALTIETDCIPLDIVFVIDQSDNTFITEEHLSSVKAAIVDLNTIVLNDCKNTPHRIAIVSYGTIAEVNVPLTLINPTDDIQAATISKSISFYIHKTKMGKSNPFLGFETAAEILNNAPSYSSDKRKRAIIFISGSTPCINCDSETNLADYLRQFQLKTSEILPFGASLLARENCINVQTENEKTQSIRDELIAQCNNNFQVGTLEYQTSTYINSISLLQNQVRDSEFQNTLSNISISHAGNLFDLFSTKDSLSQILRKITEQLSGVRISPLGCGPFAVNPYLQRVDFVFYKTASSQKVGLSYTDENGILNELFDGLSINENGFGFDVVDYYVINNTERYEIENPYPGIWNILADDCFGMDVYMEPSQQLELTGLSIPNEIIQHDTEPYYDPNAPTYIRFYPNLVSDKQNPFRINPRFPIKAQVSITNPNGVIKNYPVQWDNISNSFVTLQPLEVQYIGNYYVEIVGTSLLHVGNPIIDTLDFKEVFDKPLEVFRQNFQFNVIEKTQSMPTNTTNSNKPSFGYISLVVLGLLALVTVTSIIVFTKKGILMRRKEAIIVALIGIISGIIGILGNVLADSISTSLMPYLWIAWPIFILCTIAVIALSILQLGKPNDKKIRISSDTKHSKKRVSGQFIHPQMNKESTSENLHNDLYNLLDKKCKLSDIKDICFAMKIDTENYPSSKRDFIRELLLDLERQDRLDEFVNLIKIEKPWVLQ